MSTPTTSSTAGRRTLMLRLALILGLAALGITVAPDKVQSQYFIDESDKPARMVVFLLPCSNIDSDGVYEYQDADGNLVAAAAAPRGWTPREAITDGIMDAIAALPNNIRYTVLSCAPETAPGGPVNLIVGPNDQPADPPALTDPNYEAYINGIRSRLSNPLIWKTYNDINGIPIQNWAEMAASYVHRQLLTPDTLSGDNYSIRNGVISTYTACDEITGIDMIYLGPGGPTWHDNQGLTRWPNWSNALDFANMPNFDVTACYELDPTQPWNVCGGANEDPANPYDNCTSCRQSYAAVGGGLSSGSFDLLVWENRPDPGVTVINADSAGSGAAAVTAADPNDYELNLYWLPEYNPSGYNFASPLDSADPATGPAEPALDCNTVQCCGGMSLSAPSYPCPVSVDIDGDGVADPIEDCTDGVDNDGDFFADCYDEDCSQRGVCGGYIIINNCEGVNVDGGVDLGDELPELDDVIPTAPTRSYDVQLLSPEGLPVDAGTDSVAGRIVRGLLGISDAHAQWGAEESTWTCYDGLDNDVTDWWMPPSVPPMVDCDDNFFCSSMCNVCRNGADDDLDGLTDCSDPDCFLSPYCQPGYCPEGDPTCDPGGCADGVDGPSDSGLIDCADPECACMPECSCATPDCLLGSGVPDGSVFCPTPGSNENGACRCHPDCIDGYTGLGNGGIVGIGEICDDTERFDEDCDGLVNCNDDECCGHPACDGGDPTSQCVVNGWPCEDPALCAQPEICDDGIDNDADGLVDCADLADCECHASCVTDADGDGYLPAPCGTDCDDTDGTNYPGGNEACNNTKDDDCDTFVDCDDTDCNGHPACGGLSAVDGCMDVAHIDNIAYWTSRIPHEVIPTIRGNVEGDWIRTSAVFYHQLWYGGPNPVQVPRPDTGDPLERAEYTWYKMLNHTAEVGQGMFTEAWDADSVSDAIQRIVNRDLPSGDPIGETNPVVVRHDKMLVKSFWMAHGDGMSVQDGRLELWEIDPTNGELVGGTPLWEAEDLLQDRERTALAIEGRNQPATPSAVGPRRVFTAFAEYDFYSAPTPLDARAVTDGGAHDILRRVVPYGQNNPTWDYWGTPGTVGQQSAAAVIDFTRGSPVEDYGQYIRLPRGEPVMGDSFRTQPVILPAKSPTVTDRPGLATFLRFLAENTFDMVAHTGNDGSLHVFRAEDGLELFGFVPGAALAWDGQARYRHGVGNTMHGLMRTGWAPVNDGMITSATVWLDGFSNGLQLDGLSCPPAGPYDGFADGLDSGPSSDPSAFSGMPDGCEWHRILVVSAGRGGRYVYGLDISGVGLRANSLVSGPTGTAALGQVPYFLFELHDAVASDRGSGFKVAQIALSQIFDGQYNGGNGARRWSMFFPAGTLPYKSSPGSTVQATVAGIPLSPDISTGGSGTQSYITAMDTNGDGVADQNRDLDGDGVNDVADVDYHDFPMQGYNVNDNGSGLLVDNDADGYLEHVAGTNGALWGTPAVVDVTGDQEADVLYIGSRSGHLYKMILDDRTNPTSCLVSSPPRTDSSGDILEPEEKGVFYSPAVTFDATGNLRIFYGTGTPVNALEYDRGLFFSVIDPDPLGCTPTNPGPGGTLVHGRPGCSSAGFSNDYYFELRPVEKLTGPPVAVAGTVIFSTLGSIYGDDFNITNAEPFCPANGVPAPVQGWIHMINFNCGNALWDPSSDPNGDPLPPGVVVDTRGGGRQAFEVEGVPSAPDVSGGNVYVGQHKEGVPLKIQVGGTAGGSLKRSYNEVFVMAYRYSY